MPCFLTQRITVDLSKVDPQFVTEALAALDNVTTQQLQAGYMYVQLANGDTVTYRDGKLHITSVSRARTAELENAVKRNISKVVLEAAAKKFRWQLKADPKKQNEYVVEKRGF